MENVNTTPEATDEQLLTAADATSVDFRDAAETPAVVLGEPCDI